MRPTCWWLSLVLLMSCGFVASAELASSTAQAVRELLTVGFEPGRESLPKAKVVYDAAVKAGDKSPELVYAYGLVLAKQFKPKDAIEQFRRATDASDALHWPAWQALIFSHFNAKETTAGYDRLFDFAKRLQGNDPPVPLDEQKRLVEWMGQLVGALDKLAESSKAQETVRKNDLRLRDLLGEDLQTSYDEGRHLAADAALLVEVELDAAKEEQLAKNEQERLEKQSQNESAAESAKKKSEAVKKSAEDWKRWLDDQLKQSDRMLARLEKDYALLERRAQENLDSQNELEREINLERNTRLSSGNSTVAPRVDPRQNAAQNFQAQMVRGQQRLTPAQRIDQMLNQKIQLQVEFDRISQQGFGLSQSAARVIQQRDLAMQKYQQMTGQLVKEEAAVQKWQDRLKKDGTKLKAPASDKGATVTRTLAKAKTLRTYLDFNIADERQRLFDQIAPPRKREGEAPAVPARK